MASDIIERWKASAYTSALSTALTIYPCQIRVHQRWQSKLQLPTTRKKEWRPATAGSSPPCGYTCQHCDTHYFSGPRTRNLPIVGWLLYRYIIASWWGYFVCSLLGVKPGTACCSNWTTELTIRSQVWRYWLRPITRRLTLSTSRRGWTTLSQFEPACHRGR